MNRYGSGRAYYIASRNDARFLGDFYAEVAASGKLARVLDTDPPHGVSVTKREDEANAFLFVMNFNAEPVSVDLGGSGYEDTLDGGSVSGVVELPTYGVKVLRASRG